MAGMAWTGVRRLAMIAVLSLLFLVTASADGHARGSVERRHQRVATATTNNNSRKNGSLRRLRRGKKEAGASWPMGSPMDPMTSSPEIVDVLLKKGVAKAEPAKPFSVTPGKSHHNHDADFDADFTPEVGATAKKGPEEAEETIAPPKKAESPETESLMKSIRSVKTPGDPNKFARVGWATGMTGMASVPGNDDGYKLTTELEVSISEKYCRQILKNIKNKKFPDWSVRDNGCVQPTDEVKFQCSKVGIGFKQKYRELCHDPTGFNKAAVVASVAKVEAQGKKMGMVDQFATDTEIIEGPEAQHIAEFVHQSGSGQTPDRNPMRIWKIHKPVEEVDLMAA